MVIGFDTSCYTSSVSAVMRTGGIAFDKRTVLSVSLGERGLRQSDALFQHIRNLPPLTKELFQSVDGMDVAAVAVSAKPTAAPDSYMPVFLAGVAQASAIAAALGVPLLETTHQSGHVRAALVGNEVLMQEEAILAFHLSGGTTDMMRITHPGSSVMSIIRIGGSTDLHIGQLVDRIGVKLGLGFPCGSAFEALAKTASVRKLRFGVSVQGLQCSISGAEAQALRALENGEEACEVAYAVYDFTARTLIRMIRHARESAPDMPVLLGGGVASSNLLRERMKERGMEVCFANPLYASDNAVGTALMGLAARDAAC